MKPLKVEWKRHKSPASILAAFAKISLKEALELTWEDSDDLVYKQILKSAKWAFVETRSKPPVVHYWHSKSCKTEDLAFMLGHELGHVSGKPRRGVTEELRADEYGAVAAAVFGEIQVSD